LQQEQALVQEASAWLQQEQGDMLKVLVKKDFEKVIKVC
jgi:hypothetical protein